MAEFTTLDEPGPDPFYFQHPRANWDKPSHALVASDGDGHGCVLQHAGPHIDMALSEWGKRLDDIGLDDAPADLSIWTGKVEGGEARYTQDGTDYEDSYLVGSFRDLTDEEWSKFQQGIDLWDGNDWLLPDVEAVKS